MKLFFAIFCALVLAMWIGARLWIPPATPPGVTVISWSTDPNPARKAQLAPFLKANPDIDVKVEPNTRDKTIVQAASGVGPELIEIYTTGDMVQYADAGVLLDLTEFAKEKGFSPDVTYPKLRGAITHQGRQYRFPCNVGQQCLLFNKRMFREAGVALPESGMEWSEFIERVRPLTVPRDDGPGFKQFAMLMSRGNARDIHLQMGARFFKDGGTRSALDSAESIAAIQFYYDLMSKWNIIPTPSQSKALSGGGGWGTGEINWFMGERAAVLWGARWMMTQFRGREELRDNIGAAIVPHFPGRPPASYCDTRGSAVNAKTPNREQALRFLAYLAGREYNEIIAMSSDGLPPNANFVLDPKFLVNPEYPYEDEAFQSVMIDSMKYSEPPEISPFADPVVVETIWTDALDYVENGRKPPRDAMIEAAKRVNDTIAETLRAQPGLRELYDKRRAEADAK